MIGRMIRIQSRFHNSDRIKPGSENFLTVQLSLYDYACRPVHRSRWRCKDQVRLIRGCNGSRASWADQLDASSIRIRGVAARGAGAVNMVTVATQMTTGETAAKAAHVLILVAAVAV